MRRAVRRVSVLFFSVATATVITVALAACGNASAEKHDATASLDAFADGLVDGANAAEIAVSGLPDAPPDAHLVVACPYAPEGAVTDAAQSISSRAHVDKAELPLYSEGYSTWFWVAPEAGVVDTWHVEAQVNPCTGGISVVTAAPEEILEFSSAAEGWIVTRK